LRSSLYRLLAGLTLVLGACASVPDEFDPDLIEDEEPPLKAVGYVDMDRYMGRWYMIANIPYFVEAGNVAVYVEYSKRGEHVYNDVYTARESFDLPPFVKNGTFEITNPQTNAEGRITFLPPIWQDFAVIFLDEDYRYSVIAHPSRNYAWVFAREPRMSDSVYQQALTALADNGFDITRVLKIPHQRSELGLPGYQ
jgi:apolipoprotein D and lipocalin family protein